jgi:hypothetical protein
MDLPLHTNVRIMAECRRELLLRVDAQAHPPRQLPPLVDLQAAIKRYLTEHNAEPKPFVWTASATSILAKLDRLSARSV